jgi:phenylalanyl-tRNA synthetase alpha chain
MDADSQSLIEDARRQLAQAADTASLANAKARFLGKEGLLTARMKSLGKLAPTERAAAGKALNDVKQVIEALVDERQGALEQSALDAQLEEEAIDVTLPGRGTGSGGLHPVTLTIERVEAIFRSIGFDVADGPEIEEDFYNFTALNTPENHPARSMHDTFYVDAKDAHGHGMLLRTHTSPMQIRYLEQHRPPVRIAVPGRCYRYEATDATHEWMMQQVELLAVDEGVSMADLKGTLQEFARQMFGPERRVFLRNSYFPFVEPGVELAVDCFACPGDDPRCSVCRGGRWVEIMGAGMVHPEVFRHVGYDAERYTGFAFGMGPARIAMQRYRIPDIRLLYEADVRFLGQFS